MPRIKVQRNQPPRKTPSSNNALRVALLSLVALLCACRTVPGTGRSQLNLASESALSEQASAAFAQMPRANDPAGLARVKAIALRVITAARAAPKGYGDPSLPPPAAWEVAIIKDDSPNAFAMPGGKIGFNSGMFRLTPTDEDIAVIIGHEVAHVVCRHGNERVSQGIAAAVGAVAVDQSTRDQSAEKRKQAMAAYGAAATLGVILPFSRSHESEADQLGIVYMALAGYNPAQSVTFWQRFSKEPGARMPEFLSTHPSDQTRIQKLQQLLPMAQKIYAEQQAKAPTR